MLTLLERCWHFSRDVDISREMLTLLGLDKSRDFDKNWHFLTFLGKNWDLHFWVSRHFWREIDISWGFLNNLQFQKSRVFDASRFLDRNWRFLTFLDKNRDLDFWKDLHLLTFITFIDRNWHFSRFLGSIYISRNLGFYRNWFLDKNLWSAFVDVSSISRHFQKSRVRHF